MKPRRGSAAPGDPSERSFPRIAFFAASMKQGHDGVTRVLYKLSDKLLERGVDHIFFTAILPEKASQRVPMYKVPSVVVPFYKDYRLSVFADFQVNAVLSKYKPDILCVNSPCSLGWAAIYYAKLHHKPIVAHYHTHFVSYAKYYKVGLLTDIGWEYMKMFYGNMRRTFVPSQPILDELALHKMKNLSLLPHGVDTDVFSPRFRSETWKQRIGIAGKTALLFVGRLVWEKELATLAAAFRIVRKERDDVELVIVGDGPIRADLQHLLPDAHFLGYKSGVELSECYASADVFVFPSTTETFGMVTTEAMASGLVPVCSNAGGAAGIIDHGVTGMLAEPRDAEDFARCILKVVSNSNQRIRMADAAVRYAMSQTWDAIVDRMIEEYRTVIEEYRARRKRSAVARQRSRVRE